MVDTHPHCPNSNEVQLQMGSLVQRGLSENAFNDLQLANHYLLLQEKKVENQQELKEKPWFLLDSRCSFYKVSMFDNVNFQISRYLYHATGDCEKLSYSQVLP